MHIIIKLKINPEKKEVIHDELFHTIISGDYACMVQVINQGYIVRYLDYLIENYLFPSNCEISKFLKAHNNPLFKKINHYEVL